VFNVDGDAAEARCGAVVDTALRLGACLFDSSPMNGAAERVLAGALADRRDDAVVATKVWARTRAQGEQQIEQALDWFERIDLYQVHNLLAAGEHPPYLGHLQQGAGARGRCHPIPALGPELDRWSAIAIDAVQVPYHPCHRQPRPSPARGSRLRGGSSS
jgi:aryl-alcohol dehydrogenase-like predicted oxidoreductase